MTVESRIAVLDAPMALLVFAAFTAFAFGIWGVRRDLAERPALAYATGYGLCALGALAVYLAPPALELQRLFASLLFVGLGLLVMSSALSVSDRSVRLRRERALLKRRLARIEQANSQRSDEVAHLKEGHMAELHRLLKSEQLESELFDGIHREIEAGRQLEALERRLEEVP